MAKMVVIRDKPLRYPVSGPEGKEYKRGEEFNIIPGPYSERDVKSLTVRRVAVLVDEKAAAKPSRATKAMSAESSEDKPVEPVMFQGTPAAEPEPVQSRRYNRRDMESQD